MIIWWTPRGVLSLSGINRFPGFDWIGHVLAGVEPPAADDERACAGGHECVDLAWIENQRQYFVGRVAELHGCGIRTKWLKRILFGVILRVIVLLLLLGESASDRKMLGTSLEDALAFVLGW